MLAMRRLTRIHARSVEQPSISTTGRPVRLALALRRRSRPLGLPTRRPRSFREYLLRGGFFMCDDFHGSYEWEVFMQSMQRVFPDRPIVDIDDKRPDLPHHLRSRRPLPGARRAAPGSGGVTYEQDGYRATLARHLRRSRPPDGRHLPQHGPGRFLGARRQSASTPRSSPRSGIRIGVNYVIYAMTH